MKVDVSYSAQASYEQLLDCLSPKTILESAEIFRLESFETTDDSERVTVSVEDEELTFEFSAIEDGYRYTLVDSTGLFAKRTSELTVHDEAEPVLYLETRYSFDSRVSFILDRLAASSVERECKHTLANLDRRALDSGSTDD